MYGGIPPPMADTVAVPFGAGVELVVDVIAVGCVMVTVAVVVVLVASLTVTV